MPMITTTGLRLTVLLAIVTATAMPLAASGLSGEVKLTASDASSGDEFGHAAAISGNVALLGAHLNDDRGSSSGSAYVFTMGEDEVWTQTRKLLGSDTASGDQFGASVALDGSLAVVGALHDDDAGRSSGSAYVFERDAGSPGLWGQAAKLTANAAAAGDRFGQSVAVGGDLIVIGAPLDDDGGSSSGAAYVFRRDAGGPGAWGQVAKLTASDAARNDWFGWSVGVDGDVVVVVALLDDDGGGSSGSVYIFGKDVGGIGAWGQVAKLTANDAASGDQFGYSVDVHQGVAAVGAPEDDGGGPSSGSVYAFGKDVGGPGSWGQSAKLVPADAVPLGRFGFALSLSASLLAVGARGDGEAGSLAGAGYVYEPGPSPGTWTLAEKLIGAGTAAGGQLGFSVSAGDGRVIAGAPKSVGAGLASGSAYVWELTAVLQVEVDVRPVHDRDGVNARSRGIFQVAVLHTSVAAGDAVDCDAATVVPESLTLGGAPVETLGKSGRVAAMRDVDRDGDLDMVVHFRSSALDPAMIPGELTLTGQTIDGVAIEGVVMVSELP